MKIKDSLMSAISMFIAVLPLIWLATTRPAMAEATDWAATKGGRMRIVALPARPDGTVPAILQIEPDTGWKTYWREPGSAGIPPQVTIADGGNVAYSGLRLPVPTVFDDGKTVDYGYDQLVSIVLDLRQVTAGAPSRIKAEAFIGLCEKICVPFQASFDLLIPAKSTSNSAETGLIAQAEMALPEPSSDEFGVTKVDLSDDGQAVTLTAKLPADAGNAIPTILITNTDGLPFGKAEAAQVDSGLLTASFRLKSAPAGYRLKPGNVMILIDTGARTMETTLVFQ